MLQMTVLPVLFAEAMSARFSAQQVIDPIFSDVQEDVQEEQENNDLEEEEVSEEDFGRIQPRAPCIIFR